MTSGAGAKILTSVIVCAAAILNDFQLGLCCYSLYYKNE